MIKETITYRANYYFVNQENFDSNKEALVEWNKLSGTYTTSEGIEYSISFDLVGVVAKSGENAESLSENDEIGNYISEKSYSDFETKYNQIGSNTNPKKIYNEGIGGTTDTNKKIYNRSSVSNKQTRSHEIVIH